MKYKYSMLMRPIIKGTKQLLENWNDSKNGKDVKQCTDTFISFIYKMSNAESIIKNSINALFGNKKE